MQVRDDDADIEGFIRSPSQGSSGKCKDDLTSQVLNDAMVKEARAKELNPSIPKAYGSRGHTAQPGPGLDVLPYRSDGSMSIKAMMSTRITDRAWSRVS